MLYYWPGCTKDPEWIKRYVELLAQHFAERRSSQIPSNMRGTE
jgi:hypothetical protein